MKSHTMIVNTLSEHIIIVTLHFGGKMWFLNKNSVASQIYRSFTETIVMDTENILCNFELNQIIFLDFTGIGSLKYKEIRVSGENLLGSISLSSYKTKNKPQRLLQQCHILCSCVWLLARF